MVVSADGFIADYSGKSVSTLPDWHEFDENVKKYDNFVVGWHTFELIGEEGFANTACKYKLIVSGQDHTLHDKSLKVVKSPADAVAYLQTEGIETLFLVGGSKLSSSFAKLNLIDEVVLITQPILLGSGMNLFSDINLDMKLDLIERVVLNDGRTRVKYSVQK